MRWILLAILFLGGAWWIAFHYAPLASFNTLVPKDRGSRLVANDVAYGPLFRQHLDIYAPVGPLKKRPVMVFFYGGAWATGARGDYSFVGRALAAQGFVVIIPDYRLVPEVRFPAFLEDGAAAIRWVRDNIAKAADGDPDRIVLAGHSAGAYNAAMLALNPHWLGPDRGYVRGLAGLAGPYDFLPFDDPAAIAAFGNWPRPQETQPVHFAGSGDPPAFLATGDRDTRVRSRNSNSLALRLSEHGIPVERRRYANVDHAGMVILLSRPLRHRAPLFQDVVRFAHRVTGTRVSTDR